jgi:hypothetical protein
LVCEALGYREVRARSHQRDCLRKNVCLGFAHGVRSGLIGLSVVDADVRGLSHAHDFLRLTAFEAGTALKSLLEVVEVGQEHFFGLKVKIQVPHVR